MLKRLDQPLTVKAMAHHAGYSPRSFARRLVAETGTTPLQWLIAAGRAAPAGGHRLGVEAVAERAGFGAAAACDSTLAGARQLSDGVQARIRHVGTPGARWPSLVSR